MLTNPPNYYVALPRKASESGGVEPPVVITGVSYLGLGITIHEDIEISMLATDIAPSLASIGPYIEDEVLGISLAPGFITMAPYI